MITAVTKYRFPLRLSSKNECMTGERLPPSGVNGPRMRSRRSPHDGTPRLQLWRHLDQRQA
jgi:hypothetical protein